MAAAFAERERAERGLDGTVAVVTGGTDPADEVHGVVVEVMREVGIDVSDRVPRTVSTAELRSCDVVVTMGCSTLALDAGADVREWALPDPHGTTPSRAREIRDRVRENVVTLLDEIETSAP